MREAARRIRVVEHDDRRATGNASKMKDLLDTGRNRESRRHTEKRNRRAIQGGRAHVLTRAGSPHLNIDLLTDRDREGRGWRAPDFKHAATAACCGEGRRQEDESEGFHELSGR